MQSELYSSLRQQQRSRGCLASLYAARQVARRLFAGYNKKGTKSLGKTDVIPMIASVYSFSEEKVVPSLEDVESFYRLLDQDNDGQATLKDLTSVCVRLLCGGLAAGELQRTEVTERLDVARRLFAMFDKDGDGFLAAGEVALLLQETYAQTGVKNYAPTEEDVRSWIEMAGGHRQAQRVSFREYEALVYECLERAGFVVD